MKSLEPALREKKRYLLLDTELTKEDIEELIIRFIGILGYSSASPVWINSKIIAVNRESVNKIRASFALSNKKIKVKRVSGSIKKVKSFKEE
ncbi:MAG: hypothetical protein QXJ28_02200 [Candidatus Pacearchaeota archaeon]